MSEEIKSCPFCGSLPIMAMKVQNEGLPSEFSFKVMRCSNCGATTGNFRIEEEAVEAWQRRVRDD